MVHELEEWRAVPGFEDTYEVSSLGRVRRVRTVRHFLAGKVLRASRDTFGYQKVILFRAGRGVTCRVHRLVALAFIGAPTGDAVEVGHIDGNPQHNCVENLRWVTRAQNEADKAIHGRVHVQPAGTGRKRCALSGRSVAAIRRCLRNGARICDLAQRYGVHRSTVSRAAFGKTYKKLISAVAEPRRRAAACA